MDKKTKGGAISTEDQKEIRSRAQQTLERLSISWKPNKKRRIKAMSVNKAIVIGNVGSDPEVITTPNGAKVANFSLATTERGYKTQNGTQIPDRTEWHNIVCWGGPASLVEGYVRKGSKIYVEGKIRNRSYDDKQGVKRYITEIHVETIDLLESPRKGTGQGEQTTGAAPSAARNSEVDDLPF